MEKKLYHQPEIRDWGTVTELTASAQDYICDNPCAPNCQPGTQPDWT